MRINAWCKAYNQADREHFWARQTDDESIMIYPEDVKMYYKSENAEKATSLLNLFDEVISINETDYVTIRNNLLILILISNGHRTGVTADKTFDEFQSAIHMENDTFLISAHHHKTFATYGHAEVNTTKEQFLWLKIYIEKVPPQMQPQCSNVFVTWTGKEMVSGQISRQMALAWNKAGIFDERGVTRNVTGTTF